MGLVYLEFILRLDKTRSEKTQKAIAFLGEVTKEGQDGYQLNALLENQSFTEVQTLCKQFQDHLHHDNGDLSSFRMSYVDIVETILLALLRTIPEGNWSLHLPAIQSLIPW